MQYNILSLFSTQYEYQYFSQQYSTAVLVWQIDNTLRPWWRHAQRSVVGKHLSLVSRNLWGGSWFVVFSVQQLKLET